ncbi:PREDICTED: potassium channel subfamily K member 18, partial [Nanorana parkeri]|uniref:potassium channel subfamily K member 18 n=1 Tax=Nanorana parkeri TaxID=125878 RepID=UPI0008542FBB
PLFSLCLSFSSSAVSSPGYGTLVPITVPGRVACMVYSAIGIPLMLLVLADLGGILGPARDACERCSERRSKVPAKSSTASTLDSRLSVKEPLNLTEVLQSQAAVQRRYTQLRNIDIFELIIRRENRSAPPPRSPWKRCHSCPDLDTKPSSQSVFFNFDNLGEEVDQLDVPVLLIVLIVVTYLMLGAFILPLWEDWDMLEAFYFCFVTLSTIGFGDVFPAHPNYFLLLSLYTVVGMAIMCMAFRLMQNRMVSMYKQCVICVSRGNVQ